MSHSTQLGELARKWGTDKFTAGSRDYTTHYERHFGHLVREPIKLLEIGIGGYGDPSRGGESLRMWKEYFPHGQIFGFDIAPKVELREPRIHTLQGDQSDEACLSILSNAHGPFDIVIDDGSHVSSHVITSFTTLFPLLKPNGIYVVEDLQTSYWKNGMFGGADWEGHDSEPRDHNVRTAINYLKSLVDCLNYAERPGYVPNYFDKHIVALSFYHNLCFVMKGENDEKSNMVGA